MNISSDHKDYLRRKHTGGISNQKGNTYETFFVTKEIVRLFAEGADINSTWIISQVNQAFVDDLCIIDSDNRKCYHQLKDVKGLTWGKAEAGNVRYDFKWQKHYAIHEKENFGLKLVYSDADCPVHKNPIPDEISDVAVCEYFPAYQSLSAFLQESETLRKDLRKIMNYPGRDFPLDVQSVSLELIRSQWQELSKPDVPVSLAQIKDLYDRKHPLSPNLRSYPDVPLSSSAGAILSRFPDFHYSINGSNLYWRLRRMEGVISVSEVERILDSEIPNSTADLITLLN